MGVKLILQHEASVVTDKPVVIPFEFKNIPEGKHPGETIVISPITVRTWFRLKPLLALIEKEDVNPLIDKGNEDPFTEDVLRVMNKYDELIFEIICIAIYNKPGDMPTWFREMLKDSCTWQDVFVLLNAVLFRLQSQSFLKSITALKVVSPLGEREIIALQENKEKWMHKAASLFSSQPTKPSDTHTNRH